MSDFDELMHEIGLWEGSCVEVPNPAEVPNAFSVVGDPLVLYLEVRRRSEADGEDEPRFRHYECGCSDRSCDESVLHCALCSEVLHTGDDYFWCVAYQWNSSDGRGHPFEICTKCGPDYRSARVAALDYLTDGRSNPRVIGITHCDGGQA